MYKFLASLFKYQIPKYRISQNGNGRLLVEIKTYFLGPWETQSTISGMQPADVKKLAVAIALAETTKVVYSSDEIEQGRIKAFRESEAGRREARQLGLLRVNDQGESLQ